MKYTKLQKAGLNISKLGLGTNAVGGHNLYADVNEEEGKRLIEEAIQQGITFFDTADSYGFGRSEELVGEVEEHPEGHQDGRQGLVVADRVRVPADQLDRGAEQGGAQRVDAPRDADVHGEIIRGLRRRLPQVDLIRAQDALPEGTPDAAVLAWAASANRVLITNDRNTMVGCAYQRVAAGEPMPGLIVTTNEQAIGMAIDDILLIAECDSEEEIRNQVVVYLPLR